MHERKHRLHLPARRTARAAAALQFLGQRCREFPIMPQFSRILHSAGNQGRVQEREFIQLPIAGIGKQLPFQLR